MKNTRPANESYKSQSTFTRDVPKQAYMGMQTAYDLNKSAKLSGKKTKG